MRYVRYLYIRIIGLKLKMETLKQCFEKRKGGQSRKKDVAGKKLGINFSKLQKKEEVEK